MRLIHVAAASLLTATSFGSPIDTRDGSQLVNRQGSGSYYAITGATGGVFPRLEIRDLEKAGGEMWNLFLLAFAEFQAINQTVIDSYYQIAGMSHFQILIRPLLTISGIHGMPW
jgi:tyrosinase